MVSVVLPHHRYEVVVEPGTLARLGAVVRDVAPAARCALLADANVAPRHGAAARTALAAGGYDVLEVALPAGEAHKNLDTVRAVYDRLLDARLERRSPVIALGGGVTGDTAGFVAATYLRGVPFVQCPTTLLAMVDSSVGGKVGVNVPQGKNLIGAFHQPVAVVADPLVLSTLPAREVRCGLAECVKHAIIRDESLFDFIDDNAGAILRLEPAVISELVRRNVAIKAAVVAADERESGVRAHLNLGHTFAHAVEATTGYGPIRHGEAVALGLVAACEAAARHGLCAPELVTRVRALLARLGLRVRAALAGDDALLAAMRLDKKVQDARTRFVLPTRIGEVVIRDDLGADTISAAWAAIRG
jgi:3-dehydroquinate synthase